MPLEEIQLRFYAGIASQLFQNRNLLLWNLPRISKNFVETNRL